MIGVRLIESFGTLRKFPIRQKEYIMSYLNLNFARIRQNNDKGSNERKIKRSNEVGKNHANNEWKDQEHLGRNFRKIWYQHNTVYYESHNRGYKEKYQRVTKNLPKVTYYLILSNKSVTIIYNPFITTDKGLYMDTAKTTVDLRKALDGNQIENTLEYKLIGLAEILNNLAMSDDVGSQGLDYLGDTLRAIISTDLKEIKVMADYTFGHLFELAGGWR